MVKFTVDEIRNLMGDKNNIRNISVIAHVDHGKSTLTDSLVSKAGIIADAKAGEARFTDTREDEQERSITIKSTSISMYYKYINRQKETNEYLINLIDSPGHVDFSSEVTAALRVTDGALVVVDCVEGVCIQTETVLRQAVSERIKPVLFLNKLDRIFLETRMDFEEAYQYFNKIKENVNVIIDTYMDFEPKDKSEWTVFPEDGTVGFGSGAHAWGFTLRQFAEYYAKDSADADKFQKRLWGDHFYNKKTKKWVSGKIPKGEEKNWERGFCHFILRPIRKLIDTAMEGEFADVKKLCKRLKFELSSDDDMLKKKDLMKKVMRTWLPAGDALLQMIVLHIPSPAEAQKYRYESLYTGDKNDANAIAIKNCDQDGPLTLFVSKMVPSNEKGKFFAFGRVFSGSVRGGQKVRILGPQYKPGSKVDLKVKPIQRTILMMGRYTEKIRDVPAGNVVGLVGVDDVILKSATIVNEEAKEAMPITPMIFSVSPVVSIGVEPKSSQDLTKLLEGLKKLSKSDPLVLIQHKGGQHIISGAGELHLEICLKDLQDFMDSEIIVSDPIVNYMETISEKTFKVCSGKSPNKHNRIFLTAEPLSDEICQEIEANNIREDQDTKERAKILTKEYNFDPEDARKIWSFGCPPDAKANLFVDSTRGISYLNEAKANIINSFIKATLGGIYCDERLRGCIFKLMDASFHSDSIHRSAPQVMPACRRALCASQIGAKPKLMEPIYKLEIRVPTTAISGVYSVINKNRGEVTDEIQTGTAMKKVSAFLPVMESIGFITKLREATSGQAFAQMSFSHYDFLSGDLNDEDSFANEICQKVRKRKGMPEKIPQFEDFFDKI